MITTFIRHRGTAFTCRRFGPKGGDHPSIGWACPACGTEFSEGDYTTLVPLGPGDDEQAQDDCRSGKWYNAVAIEVHWACAGGNEVLE